MRWKRKDGMLLVKEWQPGVFEDKSTGKRLFINTTWIIWEKWHVEGASTRSKELSRNYPVIVTGDFNAVPTDDPIQVLTNSPEGYWFNRYVQYLRLFMVQTGLFHDFVPRKIAERSLIDYIFIKEI